MPYKIVKVPKGYYTISTVTGSKHSSKPISLAKATAQLRILNKRYKLEGGLVNQIPISKIFETKDNFDIPAKVKKLTDTLKLPDSKYFTENKIKLFGSYFLRIQPYFGDFDTINLVNINLNRKDALELIVYGIQKKVASIYNKQGWFITDIKAGRYPDGASIHWTPEEIISGLRIGKIPDYNGHTGENISLAEAINQDCNIGEGLALLKVDMIAPYYEKYFEITSVYLVNCLDWRFYRGDMLSPDRILESLASDTKKQFSKNKYFKVVKRLFAMIRTYFMYTKDKRSIELVKPLLPIIDSNISKISSIAGDLSTLNLLIELDEPINISFTTQEIQKFKDLIGNINDLEFDIEYLDGLINKLTESIVKGYNKEKVTVDIDNIINYILNLCKEEIELYFKSINMNFTNYMEKVINFILVD